MTRLSLTRGALAGAALLAVPAVAAPLQGSGTGCPVEMVIVIDTSGSMGNEIAAICTDLQSIISTLQQQNINVNAEFLGITEMEQCMVDDVSNLLGPAVPGSLACCAMLDDNESWGAATSIVADRYPFQTNTLRLIIPISDEAAWRGGSTCDADDQTVVDSAIMFANMNQCVVAPIAAQGSSACVIAECQQLAMATGGQSFLSTDPANDLADFIIDLTAGTCAGTGTISIACPGVSCPCGNDATAAGEGCVNSTGVGGRLDWTGGTSVANNDLSLELSGVPTNEFSTIVVGGGNTCSPLGDGLLGVDPGIPTSPFIHFPVRNTGAAGGYSTGAGVTQDLAALVNQAPLDLIGTTWRFQGVYRDQFITQSPCQTGFNLTNVVEVQFSN